MARETIWSGEIIPNGGLNDAVSPTSDEVSPDQWTAASNVEPMTDGVRRRRGSAAASNTPTQSIAIEFRIGANTREFVDGSSEYIAQSIQPASEIYVDQISARLSVTSGTPTGSVEIGIFTDNSAEPSTSALQNAGFSDYSTITAETIQTADEKQVGSQLTWFVWTSSAGKATLAASTTYWIVLRHTGAGATSTSNISVEENTAGSGTAPGGLASASPVIWLDPDDITGISDDANTLGNTIPEKTGIHPGGWAIGSGTDGVTFHTTGGATNVNGHAWIEQPSTACTNALSQGGSILSSYTFPGRFSVLVVYKPRTTGSDATAFSMITGRRSGTVDNGIACPIRSATGQPTVASDTDSQGSPGTSSLTGDTDDTDVKIMIFRRNSEGVFAFSHGTLASGAAFDFGTLAKAETIELDALFRWDASQVAEDELGIVQLVIFDGLLDGDDTIALYNWAQNRYGLTYDAQQVGAVGISTDGTNWTIDPDANLNHRVYSGVGEITAICDYQKSDGTQRHLVVADQNVYKNASGTISMVDGQMKQGFSDSSNTSHNGNLPSWSNGGDRLFITDLSTESRKFYVDSEGIERWENEGMFRPVAVPTIALATTGTALSATGKHELDFHFYNSRTGARSNPRYDGVIADTLDVTTDGSNHILLTNIPTSPQLVGDGMTHVRFMVKLPASSLFRFAKQVTVGTTTTTIEGGDEPFTVEDEYNHNPPDPHRIRLYAENRNFIAYTNIRDPDFQPTGGATIDLPWRLHWSAINGITPYIESYPPLQARDFDKSDSITALAFIPPRTLIIGMSRSIVAIDARRPGTSDVLQLSQTVGVAHHRSIIVVESVLYWLSDNPRGFYRWQPGMREPERMRGADNVLDGLDQTRFVLASTARLPEDKDRSQWWTLLSSSGATTHDTVLVHDRALDAWTVFEMPDGRAGSIIGTVLESGVTKMYLGGIDGIERVHDTGDTDDGAGYEGSVSLKAFDFQAQGTTKRLRGMQTIVEGTDDGDLELEVEVDLGNESSIPKSMDASPAGGDRIVKLQNIRTRGRIMRPTYSGSKPWRIRDVLLDIQGTRRTK